jgi:Na+/H+ antiporter NhaD/arsenite permease-like protein
MNASMRRISIIAALLGIILVLSRPPAETQAQENTAPLVVGVIRDRQFQPVEGAAVSLLVAGEEKPISVAVSQANGRFALPLVQDSSQGDPENSQGITPVEIDPGKAVDVHIERAHFAEYQIQLSQQEIEQLRNGLTVALPDITLPRVVNIAFWIASAIFVIVLVMIATGRLHNTLAALVGVAVIFAVSYLGHPLNENLFIFDFERSLGYIDWNVIFLIMGMMIIIAVVENTGIFQWLAFTAYRISGGRMVLLLPILMLITGVASAFLDNVTTMLLMTPISVQIALSLGINPLVLLIPEVMASNVVGISTLIGTPTNILIGSYANISFNDFLINLTPGVMLAFIGLVLYSLYIYRKDMADTRDISPSLLELLAERASITEPGNLKKAGVIGAMMLLLFMFGERFHMIPAVTALIGATALLVWIRPDIEEMIEAVDWTTLVFFMSLFIVIGAIQEVGLISLIAELIGRLVGDSLVLAMLAILWLSALLSTVVANIPFTAAMLPVVGFLTMTIPGAESKVLFFCLSVGSAMGGNGSLIGASANMVTAGIAERAGHPITYGHFFKKGFPALLITVGLATIWLLIRFL